MKRFAIIHSLRNEFICYANGLCPRQTVTRVASERSYPSTALHAEVA